MELTLYILLYATALFFTYLTYSKNTDKTVFNKFLCGLIWFALALNTFQITYFIPNGSTSSYTVITKNSEFYQILTALLYGMIGFSTWIQTWMDYNQQEPGMEEK